MLYHKIYDTASHPKKIGEMLIGGINIVNSDMFFGVTNIRTNVQNDSSEFEGIIHEMLSLKTFINQ